MSKRPEEILKSMFYGPGKLIDTPLKIGTLLDRNENGDVAAIRGEDCPSAPTIYYKVKQGEQHPHHVQYVYFYLYFPVDTAAPHKHDWTGGMLEVVDGVPKRLVCRSHWDMVVETADETCPHLFVTGTPGDHSLHPVATSLPTSKLSHYDIRASGEAVRLKPIHPTLVELTDEHSGKIRQIAKTASITHHETWGDRKAMNWCRYRHPFQYKALCKRYGAYSPAPWWKVWAKQFPDPSEVFDKHPYLFWEIMGVVYG